MHWSTKKRRRSLSYFLSVLFIAAVSAVIIVEIVEKPPPVGKGDFIAYWSASYLLVRGQNFADGDLLVETQLSLTPSRRDYVYRTWNPPWLLVILAPYGLLPFAEAAWLWLITSMFLVFSGVIFLWKAYLGRDVKGKRPWWVLLTAFLFLPTLTAFALGQVNTLAFFGLGGFIWAWHSRRFGLAGSLLSLVMIKPHLVYLTLPLVFLEAVRHERWRVLLGFVGTLAALTGVAWALRPSFLNDYIVGVTEPVLLRWATPTLGGFIANYFGWDFFRFIGICLLPLILLVWWHHRDRLTIVGWINISLGLSIFTAPFGWSYDAVLLLLPITQIVCWIQQGQLRRLDIFWLILSFLLIEVGIYNGRVAAGVGEVYFFWVPAVVGLVYFMARKHLSVRLNFATESVA